MKKLALISFSAMSLLQSGQILASQSGSPTPASKPAPEMKKEAGMHAPDVSVEDLKKHVDAKNAFIIDANSLESYKSGHIPGAMHFGSHETALASKLPKDKNALIIAYCGGPMCTAWQDPAKKAKELGYTNVKHFSGGIKTWNDRKMPTEKI